MELIADVVAPVETKTERPIRLAEAIRLGSMMTKPARYVLVRKRGRQVRTCAIGAALFAVGKLDFTDDGYIPDDAFPELDQIVLRGGLSMSVKGWITELNDSYHWSRERIADWVDEVCR